MLYLMSGHSTVDAHARANKTASFPSDGTKPYDLAFSSEHMRQKEYGYL